MNTPHPISERTPVLVAAGQSVERGRTDASPMDMAALAAREAIEASGGADLASAIDTIAVVKIFSDSAPLWATALGRSNNPPQSIAARIGANPSRRIYSQAGGDQPQTLLMEFFADLQAGRSDCVLLCGGEAIRNQRHAERSELSLDWNEAFEEPLEDRGFGDWMVSQQERHNALLAPLHWYSLMEDYRRQRLGLNRDDYRTVMSRLLTSFSRVAADNPKAQFPGLLSADDIANAEPLTHLYSKNMVARDGVNQGAALLLTTVGKARELGIPQENQVFMHGAARGAEHDMSLRPDPGRSPMAGDVLRHAMQMAGVSADELALLDIYSCFPIAVTAITEELGIASDGSETLTLTGGLPYFGGPGNNYNMHGLAEMWSRLRGSAGEFALVSANGGMLTKHCCGIFSARPGTIDWRDADTRIPKERIPQLPWIQHPAQGTVLAYTINYHRGEARQAVVLAQTEDGSRFVCHTPPDDRHTVEQMVREETAGQRIQVRRGGKSDYDLHFSFAS